MDKQASPQTNGTADVSAPRAMPLAEYWLRAHAREYVGRWVALRDDELVGVADSYFELRRRIGSRRDVLVTIVD